MIDTNPQNVTISYRIECQFEYYFVLFILNLVMVKYPKIMFVKMLYMIKRYIFILLLLLNIVMLMKSLVCVIFVIYFRFMIMFPGFGVTKFHVSAVCSCSCAAKLVFLFLFYSYSLGAQLVFM